jgi:hypothetical protein
MADATNLKSLTGPTMELKVNRIEGLTLVSLLDTQETYNYLL